MKHERLFVGITAAMLASALSIGAVGSLVTGFDLPLTDPLALYGTCAAAAAVCSLLFSLKWGAALAACLAAFLSGWLWHRGIFLEQLQSLLVRISVFYHNAYQWGYFLFDVEPLPADVPLAVLGGLIALTAARALVRSKAVVLPLFLAALPVAVSMVVTDTVPDTSFLFLLFLGFLLTAIPQSVRRENAAQGCRLTALTLLPAVLALSLLFYAVPREGYVNRSKELQSRLLALAEELPQKASQQMQQLTAELPEDGDENLNLKALGPRPRYTHAVMDITAGTGGILYLRGQDYDAYTGTGWTASPHRAEYFGLSEGLTQELSVATRGAKDVRYLPYYPSADTILAGGAVKNTEKAKEYSISYTSLPENWQQKLEEVSEAAGGNHIEFTQLELSQFGSTADRLRYTTLPGKTQVGAKAILDTILPQEASRFEIAETIAEFVRNSAEYDLNTPKMDPEAEDFALWFLENSDTGYCVHFATAAVVLLRAADIPARYVTGYLIQTQPGQEITVTAGEAHAWAEYYVPQLETWVVLEATPTEEILRETAAPGMDPEVTQWVPPATDAPLAETTSPSLPTQSTPEPQETQPVPESNGSLGRMLLPLLAAALIWLQRLLRLSLRKQKMAAGSTNDQALMRWREAVRLAKLLKEAPPEELEDLAQKAKFSHHTISQEELALMDRFLSQFRRKLREKHWYWQFVYRWVFVIY